MFKFSVLGTATMTVRVALLFVCLGLLQVHCADRCASHTTCRDCIRADASCKWCSAGDFKTERCMATNNLFNCSKNMIEDPKGSVNSTGSNIEFSSVTQIKPQRIEIKLRPGEAQTFNFTFKPAKNFPADLYFLFDSSLTMSEVLKHTAEASEKIFSEIQKKTKNVLLGMGTFNDKNAAPMMLERNQISSFTHKLNMTSDYSLFEKLVNEVAHHTKLNNDEPEGGFDALAQIIACQDLFGWREKSRKIVFFFTDATPHTAGDGKVAGIVYPYDGKCYTQYKTNVYTYIKELEMDYPSIAMINELAVKEGVTIIFIVHKSVGDIYTELAKFLPGSKTLTYISNLVFDDLEVDEVITQIYEEVEETVQLGVIRTAEELNNIRITFEPNCLNKNIDDRNPVCTVKQEQEKQFQGKITLLEYYGKDNIPLHVTVGSGINERLTLDIKVVDCDCEIKENSSDCSGHGTEKCGVCECNEGSKGKKCECEGDDDKPDEMSCRPEGDKNKIPCNGEGICECDTCKCYPRREGKFCECISNSCVDNCNDHGTCYCGKCTCYKGWSGSTCDCHEKSCIEVNGKPCNGRGDCVCGTCKCSKRAAWDARENQDEETCEMKPCRTCHNDQCSRLRDCAVCRMHNDETYCKSTCHSGAIQVEVIKSLTNTTHDGSICENMQADLGCYTRFLYQYDDVNYKIYLLVQTDKDCLESYYMWGGGVLAALLVIGLLTLLAWKLLTDMRDRREYERFLKAHGGDGLETRQNPIYEPATTTIRNPAFRKQSVDYTLK